MPVKILDPNLRAGWEPETPVSDTLLRQFLANQAGWATAEGSSIGARILQRDDLHSVDTGQASGLANMGFPLSPIYPDGLEEAHGKVPFVLKGIIAVYVVFLVFYVVYFVRALSGPLGTIDAFLTK